MSNAKIWVRFRCSKKVELRWSTPTGKRSEVRPRTSDYISDFVWYRLDVVPPELSEIGVDREVFRVLLRLLPRDSRKRKSGPENE